MSVELSTELMIYINIFPPHSSNTINSFFQSTQYHIAKNNLREFYNGDNI